MPERYVVRIRPLADFYKELSHEDARVVAGGAKVVTVEPESFKDVPDLPSKIIFYDPKGKATKHITPGTEGVVFLKKVKVTNFNVRCDPDWENNKSTTFLRRLERATGKAEKTADKLNKKQGT